ncbi:MAG: DUF748 domain-containing protein [Deltaproteobacteria bacterium]|nr:DUF748 domain-containing protein [Deltaproteobacteria bacterium]
MRTLRRAALVAASLLAAYAVLGFLAAPLLLRSMLPPRLSRELHRPVGIEAVQLNPFALSVTLRGVSVGDRASGPPLLSFGELYANVEASSLWRRGLVVREIRLSSPVVHLVHLGQGVYNVSDLFASRPGPAPKGSAPLRFSLGNVQVSGGSLDFDDRPKGKTHTVRALRLTLPFLSNFPAYVEIFTRPILSAEVDAKSFSIEGESKPFASSLETSVRVRVQDVDLPSYLAYVPVPWRSTLSSARLDAALQAAYAQHRDRGPTLTLTGDAALRDLAIDDAARRPLLRLPRLAVAFGPVEVFSRSLRIAKVSVEGPELEVVRDKAGRGNWADLVFASPEPAQGGAPEEPSKPLSYRVDDVALTNGRIRFADEGQGKPFRTEISPLALSVRNLTGAQGERAMVRLSLTTESAETLSADAALSLSPVHAEGQLALAGLRVAKYAPYVKRAFLLDLAGELGASTHFTVDRGGPETSVRLGDASLTLRNLTAARAGEKSPLLTLQTFALAGTAVDLGERSVEVGSLTVDGGNARLKKVADSTWNVQGLVRPPPGPEAGARPDPEAAPTPGKPWNLAVRRLTVRKVGVSLDDESLPRPAHAEVSNLGIQANDLATARNRRGRIEVTAAVNRRGKLTAKGPVGLKPLSAQLAVNLTGLDVGPFQPYFEQRLKAAVTSGAVSASGTLSVAPGRRSAPAVAFRGQTHVARFAASDAASGEPMVSFDSLALTGVDVRQEPLALRVQGIALTDFDGFITLEPDGTVNLRKALETEGPPASTAAAEAPADVHPTAAPQEPARIEVEAVTLQGGHVRFTDRHIQPAYSADLEEIAGRITGLSSLETRFADVDLRGRLDGTAPLTIMGKINPLIRDPFVDLKVSIRGADLGPATPYSGRYAGYTIEKGKLFLDVTYHIAHRTIDAKNLIVLDQFTFGDKVESPEATSLPVKLGVALLKDRKGEIQLDIPVAGSLDDPKFSVARVVWRAIVNLLTKAVTSPFALLGSVFGGGEELGRVDFASAEAKVPAAAAKKIAILAKALHERPALRLDVEGHAAPDVDRPALAERLYLRRLKAQKAKELATSGADVGDLDAISLTPEEKVRYLPKAYKVAEFPKPKNFLGIEKTLPPEEMEKLLRSQTRATDDDLRLLAKERAQTVRDALVKTGLVEADRVFVLTSALPKSGEKPGAPGVEFHLR